MLRILHGKITFQTDEEGLSFEIEMSARGTAKVVGFAKADGESKATLQFSFETDQSYLAETKRALTEMVKHFPVQKLHAR